MSRPKTIKLPELDISKASNATLSPLRTRTRSASIVKVEEVGDRSVEEVLDRSAYVNINADWVNAKGLHVMQYMLSFESNETSKVHGSYTSFSLYWAKSSWTRYRE